jgi:hypothetical protein
MSAEPTLVASVACQPLIGCPFALDPMQIESALPKPEPWLEIPLSALHLPLS